MSHAELHQIRLQIQERNQELDKALNHLKLKLVESSEKVRTIKQFPTELERVVEYYTDFISQKMDGIFSSAETSANHFFKTFQATLISNFLTLRNKPLNPLLVFLFVSFLLGIFVRQKLISSR